MNSVSASKHLLYYGRDVTHPLKIYVSKFVKLKKKNYKKLGNAVPAKVCSVTACKENLSSKIRGNYACLFCNLYLNSVGNQNEPN